MQSSLVFLSLKNGSLSNIQIEKDSRSAATTIMVSGGYPGNYEVEKPISGLEKNTSEDCIVFHSGTKSKDNQILTNGGRVLAVTAFGNNIPDAVAHAQKTLSEIHFENQYFRSDIGYEFE